MVIRRIAVGYVLVLMLAASANSAVPPSLSEALAQLSCRDIPDNAEVLRNRGRWWVSLEPLTGRDTDFALYCQDMEDELFSRLVLVVRGENNPWSECGSVVDSWRERTGPWLPYGLAIEAAATAHVSEDLGRWWLVSSSYNRTVTFGPEGEIITGPIIDTTGVSGAGTLYACHAGQWYRIGLD